MSPSYGFCLLQIPCWCEFSFSLVSLGGFPRKWASPSGSHYGKTKYGDKIAPCGREKIACSKAVWKTVLFVTPYIREKRGCAGDIAPIPTTAWRAVHRQSGTAFQAANGVCLLFKISSEGVNNGWHVTPIPHGFFTTDRELFWIIFCLLDVFR